jgi:hypothetical protein
VNSERGHKKDRIMQSHQCFGGGDGGWKFGEWAKRFLWFVLKTILVGPRVKTV